MLLVHLLLCIVALLCSCISWLIGGDIATCIPPLLILLLGYRSLHLLLIIHCLMMILGTEVGIIKVLLLAAEVILLILLVLIGHTIWTRDTLLTAIVRGRTVLCLFIVFGSIGRPVNPITKWLSTATKDWERP